MKRLFMGSLFIVAALPAMAQDEPTIDTTLNLDFVTKDVWRGINLVDDLVFVPNVHFDYGAWHAHLSGRMELTDTNSYATLSDPTGNFTAFRGGVYYNFNYDEAVDVTFGLQSHQYPDVGTPQTQELYYALDFGGVANFMLEVEQDVEVVKGYYVRASISHAFPGALRKPDGSEQSLIMGAHLAYGDNNHNMFYYGADTSTLTDLSIWTATSFQLSDSFTLSPYLEYSALVDPDLLKGADNRTNLLFGIRGQYKF